MKKRKLKLGLNKVEISNLSTIKGGNGSNVVGCVHTVSMNFLDLCCQVFGTDECPDTNYQTCKDCGTDAKSKQLNCGRTVDGPCSMDCSLNCP